MVELGTFCTNADVEKKAGTEVSSTSIQESYTNEYIQQIEGWIMAITKKDDLVSNYTELTDAVKQILKIITSNLAAVYVIQYDFSGYQSKIDAENQIQILWKTAKSAMENLEHILVKK